MSNDAMPIPAFSDEEWQLLADAPYIVFLVVAGADGKVDNKKARAFQSALVAAAASTHPTIHRMCAVSAQDVGAHLRQFIAKRPEPVSMLQKIAGLLDRHLSEDDATKVKVTLVMIGKHIAESSGGGFLGLGKKISQDEKVALAGIIQCLGISLDDRDAA